MHPLAFTFLSLLSLVTLSWAQDVTVLLNDSSIVTVPSGMWANPRTLYQPQCGGSRWISDRGQSVSLTFAGTSVKVNLLYSLAGRITQINLDGSNVATIDTFKAGVTSRDCNGLSWTSKSLSTKAHTITVTALGANAGVTSPGGGDVYISNFVYTPSSSTGPAPTTAKRNSNVGAIVGGVLGGIAGLCLVVGGALYRRKKAQENVQGYRASVSQTVDSSFQTPPSNVWQASPNAHTLRHTLLPATATWQNGASPSPRTSYYQQPYNHPDPMYAGLYPPGMTPSHVTEHPQPMSPVPSSITATVHDPNLRYLHTMATSGHPPPITPHNAPGPLPPGMSSVKEDNSSGPPPEFQRQGSPMGEPP